MVKTAKSLYTQKISNFYYSVVVISVEVTKLLIRNPNVITIEN